MASSVAAIGAAFTAPAPAWAHGGQPALATFPLFPPCVRASDRIDIRWDEPPVPSVFGPSTVFLGVTTTSTRPLYPKERPLVPWTIIHRTLDSASPNLFTWRTATVAPGHYFLWSYVEEPAMERADYVAFQAPVVLTVEHDEPVGPTVILTQPSSSISPSERYLLRYAACDPTGTARVRLEAAPENQLDAFQVIADDLPAVASGTVAWDLRAVALGRWVVRATIHDRCGHVFESYARAFVEVRPPLDPFDAGPPDVHLAGPIDATTGGGAACDPFRADAAEPLPDAGVARADLGVVVCPADDAGCTDEGCSCTTGGTGSGVTALVLLGALAIARTRRRQRA